MEFGVQFFPSVGPDKRSAEQYWGEALQLTQRAEQLPAPESEARDVNASPTALTRSNGLPRREPGRWRRPQDLENSLVTAPPCGSASLSRRRADDLQQFDIEDQR